MILEEVFEQRMDSFRITTNPDAINMETFCRLLAGSYWAAWRRRDVIERSLANSICFSLLDDDRFIGMARVVTDKATFALLCDVIIEEEYRGRGLGKWLMSTVIGHPELQGIRRWMLGTADAHDLYRQYGFNAVAHPERLMERMTPDRPPTEQAPDASHQYASWSERPAEADHGASLSRITIHPATDTDADAIAGLIVQRDGGSAVERSAKILAEIINNRSSERSQLFVARIDGVVVGYGRTGYFDPPLHAPVNVAPRGWYLLGVIVDADHRRRGIGQALTRHRMAWIAERADEVYYFANIRNRVSIELHERLGFQPVTEDFSFPGTDFEGGVGVLYRASLHDQRDITTSPCLSIRWPAS